jgi:hypothetical protein
MWYIVVLQSVQTGFWDQPVPYIMGIAGLHFRGKSPPVRIGVWVHATNGMENVKKRKLLTLPVLELRPSVVQPAAIPATLSLLGGTVS